MANNDVATLLIYSFRAVFDLRTTPQDSMSAHSQSPPSRVSTASPVSSVSPEDVELYLGLDAATQDDTPPKIPATQAKDSQSIVSSNPASTVSTASPVSSVQSEDLAFYLGHENFDDRHTRARKKAKSRGRAKAKGDIKNAEKKAVSSYLRKARLARAADAERLTADPEQEACQRERKKLMEEWTQEIESDYDEEDIVMSGALPNDTRSDDDPAAGDADGGGMFNDFVYHK